MANSNELLLELSARLSKHGLATACHIRKFESLKSFVNAAMCLGHVAITLSSKMIEPAAVSDLARKEAKLKLKGY